MTTPPAPADWNIVVLVGFSSQQGKFPDYATIAKAIQDAFTAQDPQLWSFVYPVKTPPIVPPPTVAKQWKVTAAACNIRSGPVVANNIVGYAHMGDVFEQTGTAVGWVEVGADRWISLSVLAA